ncbi:L-rhamnose isomerase [Paludicola sp. MB14-C6]|uniref:L-rhamnose isomerase n=1 Tax=Paludihabitans sp. MB14-C6 TaxID=3070656 RepID=UPI0027DDAA82|nr:L-rhamnose isomerase [Paludicola sp. MB14-C6]WMJ23175.1 L-rhamnose isomerase [Paludicola sp. MB14-C6]
MIARFEYAKKRYAELGVDVEKALNSISNKDISIHCWQGDDVAGFENTNSKLSGGIQATGNYIGKARNFDELTADFDKAISLIPGKKRINLHACYAVFDDEYVDRDKLMPKHFEKWVNYAKSRKIGIDFNPTFFSHPLAESGLTLSNSDDKIRHFWIEHAIACRKIASYIAIELNDKCLCNVWIPDGYKHIPADRLGPRLRLKDSLDKIFTEKLPGVIDCVESKVFGIGVEAYTVGSSEFYLSYAAKHDDVYNLLDNGHYHPTEMISDKISSLLSFFNYVPLHITKPVRWDSDHVVLLEDEIIEICKEIVRNNALDRVLIGLDYFDASINRIAAWVIGARNVQKALLFALLQPNEKLKALQDSGQFSEMMMLQEELKTLPYNDIWEEYCKRENVPSTQVWFDEIKKYEIKVLSKRV